MEYSFKKDIKSGLFAILIFIAIAWVYMALLDHFDRYKVESHVIQVQRLDEQIVKFEDSNGNIWIECFDYETPIDIGDEAILTIKEYETVDVSDDMVVNVKWVE